MHRLSASDVGLLNAELIERPMHVTVVSICSGTPSIDRLRATITARLSRVPRFRQVIARVPLDLSRPVWVDDHAFDLAHHVRHVALPAPADEARLQEFCNLLAAQPLDPTRPLWELWLVEGLPGRRFAVIGKVHPLVADGVRSPEITDKLFTRTRRDPLGTMPEWRPQERPGTVRLAADGAVDAALGLAGRGLRRPGRELLRVADVRRLAGPLDGPTADLRRLATAPLDALPWPAPAGGLVRRLAGRAPTGPLDAGSAGRDRLVRWVPLTLDDLGRARDATSATVSEVLLAGITAGVVEWLDRRGTPAESGDLRVLLPVTTSLRAEAGALGSRVSGVVPVVPATRMSPRNRLMAISDGVQRAIGVKQPAPAPQIAALGAFAPPTLLAQAARLQCSAPPFDLSFTNAPGPTDVRYCIGAEVLEVRPVMPLAPGRALSVAAVSYNGSVSVGLTADAQAIRDIDALAHAVAQGFADLAQRRKLRRAA